MMGKLIWLMGPSGSGKDSLLAELRLREQTQLLVAHRYITRDASAGSENHIALSEQEFFTRAGQNLLALSWHANGLYYGVGVEIDLWLHAGFDVLVNGSRAHLPQARARYQSALLPVCLQVSPEILRQRLENRGHEWRRMPGNRPHYGRWPQHDFPPFKKLRPQSVTSRIQPGSDVIVCAEMDEQWGYVGAKSRQRWLFYAYDRIRRTVVAHVFGERTLATLARLLSLLSAFEVVVWMTDGWPLYESRLKGKLHVISKRYTQRIERHNLNLRQHLARLGRKSLSFSKSVELHDKVIGHYLNIKHYQ